MMIELWVGKKIPRENSGIFGLFKDEVYRGTFDFKGKNDYETNNNSIEKNYQRRT